MLLILAPLCPTLRISRVSRTSRLHAAVMLFFIHGLAPGSALQVSHKRIWQYGRGLTHARAQPVSTRAWFRI